VTTAEAIIRNLIMKALNGDARALDTLSSLREKFTAVDVTSEERKNRTSQLPRPFEKDEYDLIHSEAREKERQHCLAVAHRKAHAGDASSSIDAGDEFVDQGKYDEALAKYGQEIALCQARVAVNTKDNVAQKDLKRAISRVGLLADRLLFAAEYQRALKCSDQAIAHGVRAAACGSDANFTWIELIHAHGQMLLNNIASAREFYLHFQSDKRIPLTSWEMVILQNFEQLRKAGHSHPLMAEIEQKLFDAGWTARGLRRWKKAAVSELSNDDQCYVIMNPNDIKSAGLLAKYGKFDQAVKICRDILQNCQARLAKEPGHAETQKTRDLVVQQFGLLVEEFVDLGRFPSALECVQELMALTPENLKFQSMRAHALMFTDHPAEAKELYLRNRGQKIGESLWETAVLADFEKFRYAARSHPLMDEIAALFGTESHSQVRDVQLNVPIAETNVPQPDDIASADRLFADGRIDEALEVLRRRIKICQGKLGNGGTNMQARDERRTAIDRISDVAFRFILVEHNFQKALEVSDEAIGVLGDAARPKLRRAHALMLLDRPDEARALYYRDIGGKGAAARIWQRLVREDFANLRNADLLRPLMDEIEKYIADQA
jgi:tetratricopeptide (TPR) repeat protein